VPTVGWYVACLKQCYKALRSKQAFHLSFALEEVMATKKILKRATKSTCDEEGKAKLLCDRSVIGGDTLQQAAQTACLLHYDGDKAEHRPIYSPCISDLDRNAGELKLMFAPRRYIVSNRFRDMDLIHIREYAIKTTSNSQVSEYPTKKGVCLTPARLFMLRSKLDEIDEQLKLQKFPHPQPAPEYKCHIGNGIYVSTGGEGFNCVDIRRYWIPVGKSTITPTRSGICLSSHNWNLMKEKLLELLAQRPDLEAALPCMHDGQEEMMQCRECMPFGWETMMM